MTLSTTPDHGTKHQGPPLKRLGMGVALAAIIRWLIYGTTPQQPRHLELLMSSSEWLSTQVDESAFRLQCLADTITIPSGTQSPWLLFPEMLPQDDSRGVHAIAPTPIDIRSEYEDSINSGLTMSPLHVGNISTPIYVSWAIWKLGMIGWERAHMVLRLGLDLSIACVTASLILALKRLRCRAQKASSNPIQAPSEAIKAIDKNVTVEKWNRHDVVVLLTCMMHPLSTLHLSRSRSLIGIHQFTATLAVLATWKGAADPNLSGQLWYFVGCICRIACVLNRPGYSFLIELACLLTRVCHYRSSDEAQNATKTTQPLSTFDLLENSPPSTPVLGWFDIAVATAETCAIHFGAVIIALNLFVRNASIKTLSGIPTTLTLIGHILTSTFWDKLDITRPGLTFSPIWLPMHLLFDFSISYYSAVTFLIVVCHIGLILTFRVALADRLNIEHGQFVGIYAAIILLVIYLGLSPFTSISDFSVALVLTLGVAETSNDIEKEDKDIAYNTTSEDIQLTTALVKLFGLSISLFGMGFMHCEVDRWVSDYTSNTNMVFIGAVVASSGLTLLACQLIGDLMYQILIANGIHEDYDHQENIIE